MAYREPRSEWRMMDVEHRNTESFQLRKPDEEREKETQLIEQLKREQQKKDQEAQKLKEQM